MPSRPVPFPTEPTASAHVRAGRLARVLARPGLARRSLSTHCEVATQLGGRLGCGPGVLEALAHAYERWDGGGLPDGLAGEMIPVPVRVVAVVGDAVLHARRGGVPEAERILRQRRGRAHDPAVVDAWSSVGTTELTRLDPAPLWEEVLAAEPEPVTRLTGSGLDEALTAVADFADLKSPALRGHSRRVARLAEEAARWCGLPAEQATALRQAGLVHDVRRVGVPGPAGGPTHLAPGSPSRSASGCIPTSPSGSRRPVRPRRSRVRRDPDRPAAPGPPGRHRPAADGLRPARLRRHLRPAPLGDAAGVRGRGRRRAGRRAAADPVPGQGSPDGAAAPGRGAWPRSPRPSPSSSSSEAGAVTPR